MAKRCISKASRFTAPMCGGPPLPNGPFMQGLPFPIGGIPLPIGSNPHGPMGGPFPIIGGPMPIGPLPMWPMGPIGPIPPCIMPGIIPGGMCGSNPGGIIPGIIPCMPGCIPGKPGIIPPRPMGSSSLDESESRAFRLLESLESRLRFFFFSFFSFLSLSPRFLLVSPLCLAADFNSESSSPMFSSGSQDVSAKPFHLTK
mmetsp:Transcript_71842/g.233484  ORF Transcript_71842/g.233484 Transcript_71842/m.233484 type:complete len:200 (+) Transcript_71842:1633-2232(+)